MDLTTLWYIWARGSDICAILCCVWAFWRGGIVEKYGAAIIGVSWLLSFILTFPPGAKPTMAIIAIDVTVLILFVALANWSRRLWVFFIAACQINAVASHFIGGLWKHGLYGYVTMLGFWGGWALLICLACGIVGYRRSIVGQKA